MTLLSLMASEGRHKAPRLLLVPCPLQGHINPMFQLATVLYSRGFSITIIHPHFNSPNPLNHPHYRFQPLPDRISTKPTSMDGIISLLKALNVNCRAPFEDSVSRFLSESESSGEEVRCIISDALMHFTGEVAVRLKVPLIVLRTSSFTSFIGFIDMVHLSVERHAPVSGSSYNGLMADLLPMREKDTPTINVANQDDVRNLLALMFENMKKSSGIIWNTCEELEPAALAKVREFLQVPVFPVGPLHKYSSNASTSLLEQDTSCITWLDKQAARSVIYMSFGSVALIGKEELEEAAWGLANSKQPFLWVIRPGLVSGSEEVELPADFVVETRERGRIVKWAPQLDVLAHPAVGGFWTHCGWNSMLESICEGQPMLGLPNFGDQRVNARHASFGWKVTIQLENGLDREEIENAVRSLIVGATGAEMRAKIKDLKATVERCVGEAGSSKIYLNKAVDTILSF